MAELIVFLLVIGVPAYFIWRSVKNGAKGATKSKVAEHGAVEMMPAYHIEGLGLATNAPCDIYRFDDRILIDSQGQKFEINIEKLRAAAVKSEQEIIEKGKSVVGRALIGTLLVPGLGTIVGGMSGIGTKKKRGRTRFFLILNYIDRNGDLAAVTFTNQFSFQLQHFGENINKALSSVQREVVQL